MFLRVGKAPLAVDNHLSCEGKGLTNKSPFRCGHLPGNLSLQLIPYLIGFKHNNGHHDAQITHRVS